MNVKMFVFVGALFTAGCGSASSGSPGGGGGGPCMSPSGTFSSNDALTAATCAAVAWHSDAYLVSIDSGPQNYVKADGTSADWTVSFSAPSATCTDISGKAATTLRAFWVNSAYADVGSSGENCMAGTWPKLTTPINSTTVVPAGVAKITAMAPAGTAVNYSADDPGGGFVDATKQTWTMLGNWGGVSHIVEVTFDSSGNATGASCITATCN